MAAAHEASLKAQEVALKAQEALQHIVDDNRSALQAFHQSMFQSLSLFTSVLMKAFPSAFDQLQSRPSPSGCIIGSPMDCGSLLPPQSPQLPEAPQPPPTSSPPAPPAPATSPALHVAACLSHQVVFGPGSSHNNYYSPPPFTMAPSLSTSAAGDNAPSPSLQQPPSAPHRMNES
jgi:hypothetical protein